MLGRMATQPLHERSAAELARLLAAREISSVELVESLDPFVGAWLSFAAVQVAA